jgi:hypothetical protein
LTILNEIIENFSMADINILVAQIGNLSGRDLLDLMAELPEGVMDPRQRDTIIDLVQLAEEAADRADLKSAANTDLKFDEEIVGLRLTGTEFLGTARATLAHHCELHSEIAPEFVEQLGIILLDYQSAPAHRSMTRSI